MKTFIHKCCAIRARQFVLCLLFSAVSLSAQQDTTAANAVVPQLVNFSGVLTDLNGKPLTGVVGTTFLLYKEEQGGAPLWLETQNVQPDKTGHYSVMLGSTTSTGLPADIFVAGEARWLGVQPPGQTEQPRVMLLSVPYALKAADAQTVGGLPPSAFVLAAPPSSGATSSPAAAVAPAAPPPAGSVTGSGTVNFLPLWTSTSNIGNSVLFQLGTGSAAKLGINTTKPASALDVKGGSTIRGLLSLPATAVATATKGANSQPLDLAASAFNSGTSAPVTQTFQWQAEPTGNNSSSPSGALNLLFGSGTSKPAETGLNIASNGQITFSPGQTFPGTITGVTTAGGSGLTGGGTSGNLNLALTNACIANQVLQWNGSTWVCSNAGTGTITGVFGGTDLTGNGTSGTVTLNLDTTKVPQLATANSFQATQTVGSGDVAISSGNLDLPQTGGGNVGVITVGGAPFIHACCANSAGNTSIGLSAGALNGGSKNNTATGYQVLGNTSGTDNTGSGYQALASDGSGSSNTAMGYQALYQNTAGKLNTAVGNSAGLTNTTVGSNNTLVGAGADVGVDGLTFATAIGSNAVVNESNALVLGGTGANAVKVGIGTAAPAYTLDVQGTGNFTGLVTFAPGQSFPGAVGSVTAGTDLNNTGTSSNPILNVDTTKLVSAIFGGTDLTGGGTGGVQTLNLDTTKVPQLNVANTFTGNQTVSGNLSATGVVTGSSFQIGSSLFALGSYANGNAFLGFAGNSTTTGNLNTGIGVDALIKNTSGFQNTAVGVNALSSNTTGNDNIASGVGALDANTTGSNNVASGFEVLAATTTGSNNTGIGSYSLEFNTTGSNNTALGLAAGYTRDLQKTTGSNNTFVGYFSLLGGPNETTLSNATAVGAFAEVDQSNSLVLGSINGVNGATADTLVGVGVTAPSFKLHVGAANNGFRVEGPSSEFTFPVLASFGGIGDFSIDAPGVANGRFIVRDPLYGAGYVGIAEPNPGHILTVGQGKGHAIADGWDTYSSRRWKTNIQTLHGALAKVEQLRGVSYDLKESGKHEVGVIAEEVGAIVPEIVSWDKNGKDAQGVDYSRLTALLIEATKEQQILIHKQQQQIKAQQMQMKAQQVRIESQEMQLKTEHSQIARLALQITAIQTSLKANHAPSSEVQRVNAQRPLMRQ